MVIKVILFIHYRLIMMFWMRCSAVSPSPVILAALVHLGSRRCSCPSSHCIYVLCQQFVLYIDHPARFNDLR